MIGTSSHREVIKRVGWLLLFPVTFLAGYAANSVLSSPPKVRTLVVPTPVPARITEFVEDGLLGHPPGTPLIVEGSVYIDGAGFALDGQLLNVTKVNDLSYSARIHVDGATLIEWETTRLQGIEVVVPQNMSLTDGSREVRFERRFRVTQPDNSP